MNNNYSNKELLPQHSCLLKLKIMDPSCQLNMGRVFEEMGLDKFSVSDCYVRKRTSSGNTENSLQIIRKTNGGSELFTGDELQPVIDGLIPFEEKIWDAIFEYELEVSLEISVGIDHNVPSIPALGLDEKAMFFLSQLECSIKFRTHNKQMPRKRWN